MKQTLQLRLGQHLTMTPQLQQAIRLLQLSSLDLQTEIRENLEANPMLEADEDPDSAAEAEGFEPPVTASDPADETPVDGRADPSLDAPDFSSAWGQAGYGVADDRDDDRDPFADRDGGSETLHDLLFEQLLLGAADDHDRLIGATLIDAISDDGYLEESLDDIRDALERAGVEVTADEVETVLHLVQSFDPPGVAARGPAESMRLQLGRLNADTHGLEAARTIVDNHLDLLAAHDFTRLRRLLRIDEGELETAVALIRSLNPHPGAQFSNRTAQYIVPDVFVRKERGIWRVRLNPDVTPRLRISPLYSGMVRRADPSPDGTFMRDHLQEARWFIRSLQSRNETLLRVATAIVERQRAFLEYGDEAMKPLVLRDIAEQLEMHESTISRVTTEKYMHTPRGVLEFKYFFSSSVSTQEGGVCSATAIRAMVRRLIAGEDRRKPLSDQRIAGILAEQGINVARRTVAKYRESMAIPPSSERRHMG